MSPFLIVGLGNPGSRYANTRHNVGTDFVLEAKKKYSFKLEEKKNLKAFISKIILKEREVIFSIPTVFMNHSGISLKLLKEKYNIEIKDILIIHDDLDLKIGKLKLKIGGGHGGHNGLKSIFENLNSRDFKRIRIGIDHPGDKSKVNEYVIKKGNKEERISRINCIDNGLEILEHIVNEEWDTALNNLKS
jgi:PTH1 family peptidyl-tRNA hydrolase